MSAKGKILTRWKTSSKPWCFNNEYITGMQMQECNMNQVFANRIKEEEVFPLTTQKIADAQKANDKSKFSSSVMRSWTKDWKSAMLTIHTWCAKRVGCLFPKHTSAAHSVVVPSLPAVPRTHLS
jgi:hypothetical protein